MIEDEDDCDRAEEVLQAADICVRDRAAADGDLHPPGGGQPRLVRDHPG